MPTDVAAAPPTAVWRVPRGLVAPEVMSSAEIVGTGAPAASAPPARTIDVPVPGSTLTRETGLGSDQGRMPASTASMPLDATRAPAGPCDWLVGDAAAWPPDVPEVPEPPDVLTTTITTISPRTTRPVTPATSRRRRITPGEGRRRGHVSRTLGEAQRG